MMGRWLVTGAGGQLGSVLLRQLCEQGEEPVGIASLTGPLPSVGRTARADLCDADALAALVHGERPEIIIHAAAITSVQVALEQPERALRINVEATARLVELAEETGARMVHISTDLVFDGTAAPYRETDPPSPLSAYGRSKAQAERIALQRARALVMRLPLMYGLPESPRETTFTSQCKALRSGEPLRLFEDEFRTPLWLEDAARCCIVAAKSEWNGILHAGGPERLSRLEMGRLMARALDRDESLLVATRRDQLIRGGEAREGEAPAEPRPADVSLDSSLFERVLSHAPGRSMAEALVEIASRLPR